MVFQKTAETQKAVTYALTLSFFLSAYFCQLISINLFLSVYFYQLISVS